jgi:hypothetical protein
VARGGELKVGTPWKGTLERSNWRGPANGRTEGHLQEGKLGPHRLDTVEGNSWRKPLEGTHGENVVGNRFMGSPERTHRSATLNGPSGFDLDGTACTALS